MCKLTGTRTLIQIGTEFLLRFRDEFSFFSILIVLKLDSCAVRRVRALRKRVLKADTKDYCITGRAHVISCAVGLR